MGIEPTLDFKIANIFSDIRHCNILFAASVLCESNEVTPTDLPGWLHKAVEPTKIS
jgi:hypothetical protein